MTTASALAPASGDGPETKTGRPRKFQDPEAFQQAIDTYFADRDAQGKPYTMHGLARALDCSRQTLLNYEQYHDADAFMEAIKSARERVAEWTEDRLHTKGFHPAGAIFSLKNNFGWTDTQVVQHQGGVMLGLVASDEQRRAMVPTVTIAQIPNENADRSALGTTTDAIQTFAPDASLSPVSLNSCAVEKPAK